MDKPKGFSDRVEKWLAKIPGVRTYRDREHRRETDKKLREHLGSILQQSRTQLKKVAYDLSARGDMKSLQGLDRLSSHIQQAADSIRYASYGYSGIFDLEKIREDELDRLYAFDLSLAEDLDRIGKAVGEIGAADSPETRDQKIQEADRLVDSVEARFNERREYMSKAPSA
ncbi:MAG TPA: hypothetical protein VLS90_00870 [Thermodesulfobacteriota bacterium]|nr:hypothetical protein [Thermodesulfobacteriota bacterium]